MRDLEPYVGMRELSELMGVSYSTIKRWLREEPPVPNESWGMRRHWFRPTDVRAWARARAATVIEPVPTALERRDTSNRR